MSHGSRSRSRHRPPRGDARPEQRQQLELPVQASLDHPVVDELLVAAQLGSRVRAEQDAAPVPSGEQPAARRNSSRRGGSASHVTARPTGPGLPMAPGIGSSSSVLTVGSMSTSIANVPARADRRHRRVCPAVGDRRTRPRRRDPGRPARVPRAAAAPLVPPRAPATTSSQRPVRSGFRLGPCITLNRRMTASSSASQPVTGTVAPDGPWRSRSRSTSNPSGGRTRSSTWIRRQPSERNSTSVTPVRAWRAGVFAVMSGTDDTGGSDPAIGADVV